MTLHYHGTPITPLAALYQMSGLHLCVSVARPEQVRQAHQIAQSVMLDNGAFSAWRTGTPTDWPRYYDWTGEWLSWPTTWAVIPDVVEADEEAQDLLLEEWPHGYRGVPVWHMHESLERLERLIDSWPKVCIGSSAEYAVILSDAWTRRMDAIWNRIGAGRLLPYVHMLRGMQLAGHRWPFASLDSTDVARNHARPQNTPRTMAERWDAQQCPGSWRHMPEQMVLR